MAMKLTKEQREKMFKLLPMTTTYKHKFALDGFEDFPKEYQPSFVVTQMTPTTVEKVQTMAIESQNLQDKKLKTQAKLKIANSRIETMADVVVDCLVSWENVWDMSTEEEINMNEKNIRLLPQETIASIFMEIMTVSGMGE